MLKSVCYRVGNAFVKMVLIFIGIVLQCLIWGCTIQPLTENTHGEDEQSLCTMLYCPAT